ncbi:MAG: hypothetical protein F6K11_09360 [Leptolyngbya sp. SIO3F4]|nr:hypothetical protein [Leptolyngbya sp. SIO3F4]
MTDDSRVQEQRVKGATGVEGTFRQKFETNDFSEGSGQRGKKKAEEPGYMARKREEARRFGRQTWNVLWGTDPLKDENKPKRTYQVKSGKLTVTDERGQVVMESQERGLEKYNGVTLSGEQNKRGEIEVKSALLSKQKIKEGNDYLTPQEKRELVEEAFRRKIEAIKNFRRKPSKWFDNWFLDKAAKNGYRRDKRKRLKDLERGRRQ